MDKNEKMDKIKALHRRIGDPMFRMALTHLFDAGWRHTTPENITFTKESIKKNTVHNAIMTADFQCELLDVALELKQFEITDLLLYIRIYLPMLGDDLEKKREIENELRSWIEDDHTPQKWNKILEEEIYLRDTVDELFEIVEDRDFTKEEIEKAINYTLATYGIK